MEKYFNDEWNLPPSDEIRKAIEEVFKNPPVQERKMKLYHYCLSIGGLRFIDTSTPFYDICHNERCINCRGLEEIMRKEIRTWLAENKVDESKEKNM